ncbi:hypothetical protein Amsp01_026260 [Amycolatopsis sp. NBRC 101858]|nr:hypothetical protein Amsp01_026260 [Amycolatopsis sp. NBRC 101858]
MVINRIQSGTNQWGERWNISADYGDAIGSCNRVRGDLAQAMRRPEQFGGDALGPVYQAYLALHDCVSGLLSETKTNLDDRTTPSWVGSCELRPADAACQGRHGQGRRADGQGDRPEKATQSGANPDRNAIRQHFAFIESMFEPSPGYPIRRGTTR